MTILTRIQCSHVVGRFTRGCGAVVAAGTAGGHICVVKYGSGKCIGIVAIIADVTAGNMVGRFSGCCEL